MHLLLLHFTLSRDELLDGYTLFMVLIFQSLMLHLSFGVQLELFKGPVGVFI
jgi:hypothetical protein